MTVHADVCIEATRVVLDPLTPPVPAAADVALETGAALGGFVVEEQVGAGGMGVVYRASDPECGRTVALKVMNDEHAHHPQARALFVREMLIAAAVEHPHIVPVYKTGSDANRLYLAMRYVPGTDLAALTSRHGGLHLERALGILERVAQALETAHRRGVLHGDIKPSNILVGNGGDEEVYLSDFGLSCSAGASRVWGGTPRYQAPEIAAGQRPTERSDVYSLACTLHQAVTATPPARTSSSCHFDTRSPGRCPAHDLPRGLMRVLERGMARDPGHRPPTPKALIAAATAESL